MPEGKAPDLKDHAAVSQLGPSSWRTLDDAVVKSLPGPDGDASLLWLQHAIETFHGQVPHALGIREAVRQDGSIHLVRPFLEGVSLQARLQEGPLAVPEALGIALSVARCLESTHAFGILHGNLKASNVILSPAGEAFVADFGLSSLRDPLAQDVTSPGRYLSPEQSGLLDYEVGEWSDLYSLGVLLYECLAGRPPFEGETLGELLRQHLNMAPKPLRSRGIEVPTEVDEILQRLLRKDPRDRYQSAHGLAVDLEAVLDSPGSTVVGAADRRQTLTEPAFLGRRDDLARLEATLEDARQGKGFLAYVEAESGGGKSRMLQEFSYRAQLQDAWLIRGQGKDQSAPQPFGMLEGVVQAMQQLAGLQPERLADIKAALEDDLPQIIQTLPGLGQVLGLEAADSGPEEHGPERTQRALTELLFHLGSSDKPAILVLDDMQWSDLPTRRLLDNWWRLCAQRPCHLVVVASFRTEEVDRHDVLRLIEPTLHLELPPFDRADIQHLAESMAGPVPEEAVQIITRLAGGNPFMASATLRGLVEAGILEPGDKGWRLAQEGAAFSHADVGMAEFLLRRLYTLPPETQELLAVGAILGKEFDAGMAATLARLGAHAALSGLNEARRRHILMHGDRDGWFIFTHDKLREAVLSSLAPERRRDLHREAARSIRDRHADHTFDLAYHYDAAGEHEKAFPHALASAEEARHRFALDVAERYYRIALRAVDGAERGDRFSVLHGMGETLMLRGAYEDAAPWFEKAQEWAEDDLERAALQGRIGELWFKKGDLEKAAGSIEAGLRILDQPAPTTKAGHLWRLPKEVFVQVLHSMFPKRFLDKIRDAEAQTQALAAARLYSDLAHVNWFLRGPACTGYAHLREMNLAERLPPGEQLAYAYAEHAVVMTTVPWHGRGRDYGERSMAIRTQNADLWGQAHSHHFQAIGLLAEGRLEESLEKVQEATRIFDRTGDLWQANNAGWHVPLLLWKLGHREQAVREAERFYERADRIGDVQNTSLTLMAWALAAGDALPYDLIEREKERVPKNDAQSQEGLWLADGVWWFHRGDLDRSLASLQEAFRIAKSASLRSEYVALVPSWLASCHRRRLEEAPAWVSQRSLRSKARRAVRVALRWAKGYVTQRPQAWREAGLVEALCGRPGRAQGHFVRSYEEAVRLHMTHEVVATASVWLQVGRDLGWSGLEVPAQALAQAQSPQRRQGATLALADRFNKLIDVGSSLAASTDPDAIVAELERTAREVLRGDTVQVVTEGGLGSWDEDAHALAQQCLQAGRPIVGKDVGTLRSALCFPVFGRSENHAIIVLVGHGSVEDLYGSLELDVARFLAAIGGAALESAEGFRELEIAHDRLEFQASLLASEAEAMVEGLLVVDPEGQIISYNRRLKELWSLPDDDYTGAPVQEVIAQMRRQAAEPEAFEARIQDLEKQSDRLGEDEVELRDGRVFERYSAPVRGDDGTRYGRAWYFRDVTERKRYEETLRDSYERLQEVDRMKTAFVNTAAHELNTPLTPIRLQLALLRKLLSDRAGPMETKALDTLHRNIERLQDLVRDIMDTARIEGDRLRVEQRQVQVGRLVQECVEAFQEPTRRAQVTLVDKGGPDLELSADPKRITQVMFNLLNNALRFTPEGGQIEVHHHLEGDACIVKVRDSGAGMSQEQREQLFVPFNQPVPSPTGKPTGTGLGLVICKGIVEEHGGRIWAESDGPGRGTTFSFSLPMRPRKPVRRPQDA